MKRIIVFIILSFCCCIHFVCAQSTQKRVVVSEKNGNVIIGDIVEENNEFIKIVKYDDKLTRIIYRSNIATIADGSNYKNKEEIYQETLEQDYIRYSERKEEKRKRIKAELAKPQKGFQQSVEMVTNLFISGSPSQNINYIVGYRFNDYLYLGAGVGIGYCHVNDVFDDSYYYREMEGATTRFCVPLHVNFRLYLTKTRFQPFVNTSIGCNIPIPMREYGYIQYDRGYDYDSDDIYEYSCSAMGLIIQPGIGFNFRINRKVSLYATLCYHGTMQQAPYLDEDNKNVHISNRMNHGICFKWGFTF